MYEHYSIDRAEEIATNLESTAQELDLDPNRGALEKQLRHRAEGYRFILFKRTNRAETKIIYYIDEPNKTVFITDFFPTEKDNKKISRRN